MIRRNFISEVLDEIPSVTPVRTTVDTANLIRKSSLSDQMLLKARIAQARKQRILEANPAPEPEPVFPPAPVSIAIPKSAKEVQDVAENIAPPNVSVPPGNTVTAESMTTAGSDTGENVVTAGAGSNPAKWLIIGGAAIALVAMMGQKENAK